MNKTTKKRMIAAFLLFIMVFYSVDFSFGLEASDIINVDVNIDKEDPKDFEDIAVFVDSYEPPVIKTWFLEKKDYPVYLTLSGIQINPTVDISKIRSIRITASDANSRRLIGGPISIAPPNRRYTLSNLGGVIIPLKKIPREDDVPKRIDVNLTAYIDLDISGIFDVFETNLILAEQQDEEKWFATRSESAFLAGNGYIRINKIQDNFVELIVYDDVFVDVTRQREDPSDFNFRSRKQTIRLGVGETSHVINLREDVFIKDAIRDGRFAYRDRVRVRLNEIRNAGKYAELTLVIDGIPQKKTVYEGSAIYEGSSWKVKSISVLGEEQIVEISDGRETKQMTRKLKETTGISGAISQGVVQGTTSGVADPFASVVEEISKKLEAAITQRDDLQIIALRDELLKIYGENYNKYASVKKARNLLSIIVKYYSDNNTDGKYNIEINYIARELSYIDNTYNKATQAGQLLDQDSKVQDGDPSRNYYNKAVEDFNAVLNSFPSSDFAPRSTLEAARTRSLMGDTDGAISYYNRYLSEFSGVPEVEANRRQVEFIISELQKDQSYDILEANIVEGGKKIDVRISNVKVSVDSSKAYVTITDENGNLVPGDQPVKLSTGSQVFSDERFVYQRWYVQEIFSDKIKLYRIIDDKIEEKTIYLNRDAVIVSTQKGPRRFSINKIDFSSFKEAHLTVLPAQERFVSKSDFSAHFIIEKRLFELTPKQIDNHIKTTKNLISKFDSAIDALDKIHKVWTTWCYGVLTTLWIKNLITSFGGRNLARKTVMEKWNQICDYRTYQPQDPKLKKDAAYDECIRLNSKQIQQEINKANDAVSKVDEDLKKIESGEDTRFSGIDIKENKDLLRDHLLKENLARELKEKEYVDDYLGSYIEVQKQVITSQYAGIEDDPDKIKEVLEARGYKQEYDKAGDLEKKEILQRALTNTIEDRTNNYILGMQKDIDKLPITTSVDRAIIDNSVNNIVNQRFFSGKLQDEVGGKGEVYVKDIVEYDRNNDGVKERYLLVGGSTYPLEKEVDLNEKPTGREYYVDNGNRVYIQTTKDLEIKVDPKASVYKPEINVVEGGRHQGLLHRVTIDEYYYIEIDPEQGRTSSGSIQKIDVFKRVKPNTALGDFSDVSIDNDLSSEEFRRKYPDYYGLLVRLNNEISPQRKLGAGGYVRIGGEKGQVTNYVIGKEVSKRTGASCPDFMDANDCLFLYGACDPIMCPSSRFNRGGNYYVNNVVASGIFGSIFLGAETLFDPSHGEVLPVCLTGINAGAKNYRSILQGYVQCLEQKRDKGQSVGVCDRIRNIGICSVVWREAVAILNVDGGGLGVLSNKLFDKGKGGGEYAFFKEGIKNNLDFAKFYTSQYASNVFAAYRSDTVGEIGTEICQSAIYGRIPGTGSIIERLSRPAGPAQFTAILDEVPRSTISRGSFVTLRDSISDYQVYYHIYAGDQSDFIRYSVELHGAGLPPRSLTGVRVLRAGEFVDQNEVVLGTYSGYDQICIQVNGNTECGFGIVSTDYGINKLKDKYVENQAQRTDITSERQCVPEPGLISSASGPVSAAAGVFSSGLVQTPVIRKCSSENPGIRDGTQTSWVEVGVCGKDEIGRDLGKCYLDTRSTENILKDKQSQEELDKFLQEQRKVALEGLLSATQIQELLGKAGKLIDEAKSAEQKLSKDTLKKEQIEAEISSIEQKYKESIRVYDEIIQKGTLDDELLAEAYFKRGTAYQSLGLLLSRAVEEIAKAVPPKAEAANVCKKESDSTWLCENAKEGLKYLLQGTDLEIRVNEISKSRKFLVQPIRTKVEFDAFLAGEQKDCNTGVLGGGKYSQSFSITGTNEIELSRVISCNSKDISLSVSLLYPQTLLRVDYRVSEGVSFKVFFRPPALEYIQSRILSVPYNSPTTTDVERLKAKYQSIIEKYLKEKNLPPDEVSTSIIFGIMWEESKGITNAESPTGCQGLMQLCGSPSTLAEIGVTDRFDEEQNIKGGIEILKQKYNTREFVGLRDRLKFAILSYNLGEAPVIDAIKKTGIPDPSLESVLAALTPQLLADSASVYRGRYFPDEASRQEKIDKEAIPYVPRVLEYARLFRVGSVVVSSESNLGRISDFTEPESIVPPSFVPPVIPEISGLGDSIPEQ